MDQKKIGIIKEDCKRRPITLDTAKLYDQYHLLVEHEALNQDEFSKLSNVSFKTRAEVLSESDAIITMNGINDTFYIKNASIVELGVPCNPSTISCHPRENGDPDALEEASSARDIDPRLRWDEKKENHKIKTYNLTKLPRVSRAQSMDILSSQANLVGYRAVIEGAYLLDKVFPLMMTSAGTIAASRVLILGVGVAGLQAIATAKRLGCIVSAFDVRPSVKEQVESLGATFIEMIDVKTLDENKSGYANEAKKDELILIQETIAKHISKQDLIITTAQVPGKTPPLLITKEMLKLKKKNSIIIDIANGNSAKDDSVYVIQNILDKVSNDASAMLAKNVVNFLNLLFKNPEDELITACLIGG